MSVRLHIVIDRRSLVMTNLTTKQLHTSGLKEFWDSLRANIIDSDILPQDNIVPIVEQSIMFSMFFRNYSQEEIQSYRKILDIKNYCYMMLLEFHQPKGKNSQKELESNNSTLYYFLKKLLKNTHNSIGPMLHNRISILISDDENIQNVNESLLLAKTLINKLNKEFHITTAIGIGNMIGVYNVYTSFIEAVTSLNQANPNQIKHINNVKTLSKSSPDFDYFDTVRHMLEAIRLNKSEAFNYFNLLMEMIPSFTIGKKRSIIIELLSLASYTKRSSYDGKGRSFNLSEKMGLINQLEDQSLIEFAYRSFLDITGSIQPKISIDYSNKIVQSTKEFLETHYMEDISLEDVAAQANISPQYFSKLIKKTTGFNFIDWLSMLRVKKAKELLTNTDLTVKEVCYLVGYKDPNYFSRIFKKRIGITPTEFIKQKQNR